MSCEFVAAQQFCLDSGTAPSVSRRLPCRAWFRWTSKEPEVDSVPRVGSNRSANPALLPRGSKTTGPSAFRGCCLRIRVARRIRRSRAGSQVKASTGPQVPFTLLGEEPPFSRLPRPCRSRFWNGFPQDLSELPFSRWRRDRRHGVAAESELGRRHLRLLPFDPLGQFRRPKP